MSDPVVVHSETLPDLDSAVFPALKTPGPKRKGYFVWSYKPDEAIPQTYVYAMECAGHLKIGLSFNPKERLLTVQSQCPLPVRLVLKRLVRADKAHIAEFCAHDLLWTHHHHGEWFSCDLAAARDAVSKAIWAAEQMPFVWIYKDDPPDIWTISPYGTYRKVPVSRRESPLQSAQ